MIVSACMFIMGYAMTWAPGVWILIGETFATRTRAKQGALSTASNWYGFYFLLWCFQLDVSFIRNIGYGISSSPSSHHSLFQLSILDMDSFLLVSSENFYLSNGISPMSFTACNLTGAVVVYFFLYESADLSLENVDRVSSQHLAWI
jgi:SP family sugar:H+ symporter-like MFS transporter